MLDSRTHAVDMLHHERALLAHGFSRIAGVDEVGRGSWAGPLVAAAVVLPLDDVSSLRALAEVRDSKTLDARTRDEMLEVIREVAIDIGIGWCSHHVIDAIGLGPANRTAMMRAISHLRTCPEALLVDFFRLPDWSGHQRNIPKGDACSLSVAAASIVAKVIRDRWMSHYHLRTPEYGFDSNKGYGTPRHRKTLQELGPCAIHRVSFRPVSGN